MIRTINDKKPKRGNFDYENGRGTQRQPLRELILMVGKSGSGKDHICNVLGLKKVVSRTTREIRMGEEDGVAHIFVTKQDIAKYPKSHIVAYTEFDGSAYCALRQDLAGKDVYIIDPAGIQYFVKYTSGIFRRPVRVVYIRAKWWKRLYRMTKRDGIRKAIKRIRHDRKAFSEFERSRIKMYTLWN